MIMGAENRLVIQAPRGRVDHAFAHNFRISMDEAIEQLQGRDFELVVDLSKITFMDSSGFRELLRIQKIAGARNGKILLDMVSDNIEDKLRLTGLDSMLPEKQV